jgi:hypothetical protein
MSKAKIIIPAVVAVLAGVGAALFGLNLKSRRV